MRIAHDPLLVLLSLVVAMQASYVGLRLALRVADAAGLQRKLCLAGSALSLGVGVWSMHFVGMLAARLPVTIDYLVLPTLISFLVCVLVVGAAIVAVSVLPRNALAMGGAAIGMGGGIATMHYIGMTALHASAHMTNEPLLVAASVLLGIGASGLALWLAFGKVRHPPLFVCAAVQGLAISGMHYTAMAGMALHPMSPTSPLRATAMSPDLLAVVVAVVAFIISGLFLLTIVPEHARAGSAASTTHRADQPAASAAVPFDPQPALDSPGEPAAPVLLKGLPIERDGIRQTLPQDQVFAVHANAHYTYVFNGREKLFCSLSIGEAESCLDAARFLRVHRSHIVNLSHVAGVRRAGDNGMAQLTSPSAAAVPVSRNKLADLRARLSAQRIQAAE